ncbi:MAG: type II secretion system protein [Phycisphaerales bacterium]
MRSPVRQSSRSLRGFTLIEVIATLLVLGVVIGMIVPRVTTSNRRQAENSVRSVASLIATAAQRASTSSETSAIVYDHDEGTIYIEVLRQQRGNYDRTERQWRRDPFVPEITLQGTRISEMTSGGVTNREQSFRIVLEPGVVRPQIAVVLAETVGMGSDIDRSGQTWRIDLPTHALRPVVTGLITDRPGRVVPQPIDLDALGRVDQSW